MNDIDREQVKDMAELEVRRYFDHYLKDVLPVQMAALKADVDEKIALHDAADASHGRVKIKLNRLLWIVMGAASVGGGSGLLATKLLAVLGG